MGNLFISLFIGFLIIGFACGNNQSMLMTKLFSNYHSEIIPQCEDTPPPVNVYIGLAIRQVIELNEPRQILTINAWLRLRWTDCKLVWNSSEYGGIDNLIIPFDKIWTPDITLYDNAMDGLAGLKDYRPDISSDGTVNYYFPTVISSLCRVDVTYFPFDTQTCALPFGSWAYNGFDLNVMNRSESGDITTFKTNTEWEVPRVPMERHVIYYECCPEPYPDVTFYVTLRRKPLFYVLNLLFPCTLITCVAMLGFLLPPDAGEKVSLEITVLLSLAVFLLVVSETLPPTSENFPYIGIYFACAMVMVSVSTILTVFVLNFHFKGQHGRPVPTWIRKVFLGSLARFLLVKDYDAAVHPLKLDMFVEDIDNGFVPKQEIQANGHTNQSNNSYRHDNFINTSRDMEPVVTVLKEQLKILRKIAGEFSEQDKKNKLNSEWQRVAMVMDRLFLLLFFCFTMITTLSILLQCIVQY